MKPAGLLPVFRVAGSESSKHSEKRCDEALADVEKIQHIVLGLIISHELLYHG